MEQQSFNKLKLDEARIAAIENEVLREFNTFNRAAQAALAQYITDDGIDWDGLREGYRRELYGFSSALQNVFLQSGRVSAADATALLGRTIAHDPLSPSTLQATADLRNRVLLGLQQRQQEALQELRSGLANQTPIRSAQEVRQSINLTAKQIQQQRTYRTQLENNSASATRRKLRDRRFDPTVTRARKDKKMLSTTQIDRMVTRYAERQLTSRAKTIAATEAVRIANSADHDLYEQAIGRGDVERSKVKRKWIHSKDEKVRNTHIALGSLDAITAGETWTTTSGAVLQFPGDPAAPAAETVNCRCWVQTTIDEKAA